MKKNYLCMIAVVLIISGVMTAYRCSNDQKQTAVSPTDDSSQFTNITDVVPDAILEIRYYGTYNFVGTRVDGYLQPTALLTKQAAQALDSEWWHFTLKDEPFPDTYFTFPVKQL